MPNTDLIINAFKEVIVAYIDYEKIHEQEKTKRDAIKADRDMYIEELKIKKALFIKYMNQTSKDRSYNYKRMFDSLDNALKNGDHQGAHICLTGIIEQFKTSTFGEGISDFRKFIENKNEIDTI